MNIKTISVALLAIGICIILAGVMMDTTVGSGWGRVHNIGLISDRQNLLFLGGLLFFSGIVLFAVYKLKQTPADEAKVKGELENKQKVAQEGVTGQAYLKCRICRQCVESCRSCSV